MRSPTLASTPLVLPDNILLLLAAVLAALKRRLSLKSEDVSFIEDELVIGVLVSGGRGKSSMRGKGCPSLPLDSLVRDEEDPDWDAVAGN